VLSLFQIIFKFIIKVLFFIKNYIGDNNLDYLPPESTDKKSRDIKVNNL